MVAAAFCHDIDHRGTNNLYQTKQVEMFYLMPGGCFVCSFLNSVFNLFSNLRLFNFVGVPILWLNFMAPPSWRGTIWSTARHSWLTRYDLSLDKKSNKLINKTTDLKFETHMVWPLFTVSSRDWTSSATFRSASLSMCSTCLTSASLPLIWPFTSSRLSEIHFWISSMCLSPRVLLFADSVCIYLYAHCLVQLLVWQAVSPTSPFFRHTEKEPCSRTLWMPQSQWRMRRRPFPMCPTTPSGRKSSCTWPIAAGHHAPAESALPSLL